MQVTIDSSDDIKHVLSVLQAVFGAKFDAAPAAPVTKAPRARAAAPRAKRTVRAGRPARGGRSKAVDAAAVRAWANDSGVPVSARGPIPASLRDAYLASVGG